MQVYWERYGVDAKGRKWSIKSRSKKFLSPSVCLDWLWGQSSAYQVDTVLIPLEKKRSQHEADDSIPY
jgi:hypothetical protein